MILARVKNTAPSVSKEKKKGTPDFEEFIATRDFQGAVTLLEFQRKSESEIKRLTLEWLAYAYYHNFQYSKAIEIWEELLTKEEEPSKSPISVFIGCAYFYLGMFKEADTAANAYNGPPLSLQNRLQFHLAHKFNDEARLMYCHQKLQDATEDKLCFAAIHYLRSHYNEAIELYKRILLENREYTAVNLYIALCYYKLEYHDVSQEILTNYLQPNPHSAIAVNLKACNYLRIYNGKTAEAELKQYFEQQSSTSHFGADLMNHNLVVFRGGENALQVLPPLLDKIPEARLNLVIYYLRNDDIAQAHELIKDLEPTTPQEYTLKGVVNAAYGQLTDQKEFLKIAQQYFQLVGSSPNECDTIPGRQCMAACFFLLRQFEDVLIYLTSIKSYFQADDDFHWNYGIAKAASGEYKDAEEAFLSINNEKYKSDHCYLSWLARCFIMNGKARQAWELHLKMEASSDSFSLLQIIANDCYKTAAYFYSAKAYDVLEQLDASQEYSDGKRCACIGVFRQVVAEQEPKETLKDIIGLLRKSSNPQVDQIVRVITKWGKDNGIKL